MKKIINGKRYDTDTAKLVGEYDNDYATNDFRWYMEELYKKRTGEFFLYGEGGGLSKYSESYGDSRGYGNKFTPLNIDEAKEWMEKNCDAEEYEEVFEIEEEGNIAFSLLIPENLYNKLKEHSEEKDESMKEVIVKSLEKYLG